MKEVCGRLVCAAFTP
ncbi:hypothetical protein QX226_21885 [Vibrio vulnificus]|nr:MULTISPECIES: hypothetical protein [Vibrio]MCD2152006.1 hypothetical protein [Vibrio parahaemolyticus]MCU8439444.1 hypothetical protein [Vibrio vulnificus]MDK2622590.1 hypothetical protein [Vibrio vulnificus]MDS1773981.1 hypothetical protein [Vibrio vulnificus]